MLREDVTDRGGDGHRRRRAHDDHAELAARLRELPERQRAIRPFVSNEIVYLTADEEEQFVVAQANVASRRRRPLH